MTCQLKEKFSASKNGEKKIVWKRTWLLKSRIYWDFKKYISGIYKVLHSNNYSNNYIFETNKKNNLTKCYFCCCTLNEK